MLLVWEAEGHCVEEGEKEAEGETVWLLQEDAVREGEVDMVEDAHAVGDKEGEGEGEGEGDADALCVGDAV